MGPDERHRTGGRTNAYFVVPFLFSCTSCTNQCFVLAWLLSCINGTHLVTFSSPCRVHHRGHDVCMERTSQRTYWERNQVSNCFVVCVVSIQLQQFTDPNFFLSPRWLPVTRKALSRMSRRLRGKSICIRSS